MLTTETNTRTFLLYHTKCSVQSQILFSYFTPVRKAKEIMRCINKALELSDLVTQEIIQPHCKL